MNVRNLCSINGGKNLVFYPLWIGTSRVRSTYSTATTRIRLWRLSDSQQACQAYCHPFDSTEEDAAMPHKLRWQVEQGICSSARLVPHLPWIQNNTHLQRLCPECSSLPLQNWTNLLERALWPSTPRRALCQLIVSMFPSSVMVELLWSYIPLNIMAFI